MCPSCVWTEQWSCAGCLHLCPQTPCAEVKAAALQNAPALCNTLLLDCPGQSGGWTCHYQIQFLDWVSLYHIVCNKWLWNPELVFMKKTFASISCLEASSFFIGFGAIQNALRGLDCYPLPRGTFQAANRQQTCCSQKALAGVRLRGSAVPGPWQQRGCCPLTQSELWGDAPMGRRQPAVNHGPRLMVGLAGLP